MEQQHENGIQILLSALLLILHAYPQANQVSSVYSEFESITTVKTSFVQLDTTAIKELRCFQEHISNTGTWDLFVLITNTKSIRVPEETYRPLPDLGAPMYSSNNLTPVNPL